MLENFTWVLRCWESAGQSSVPSTKNKNNPSSSLMLRWKTLFDNISSTLAFYYLFKLLNLFLTLFFLWWVPTGRSLLCNFVWMTFRAQSDLHMEYRINQQQHPMSAWLICSNKLAFQSLLCFCLKYMAKNKLLLLFLQWRHQCYHTCHKHQSHHFYPQEPIFWTSTTLSKTRNCISKNNHCVAPVLLYYVTVINEAQTEKGPP